MKKHLLAIAVSAFSIIGLAFATVQPQTPMTTTKPIVRPSLNKLLDKRPTLPGKSTTGAAITGKVQPSTTGKVVPARTATPVVKQVVRQNAEDVKAFREENGYIIRYLKKAATPAEKRTITAVVEKAIKALLAEQKKMRAEYEAAAKTTTLMTQSVWDSRSQVAVAAYKDAVLPYIDSTKMTDFEKFITGRLNLMKGLFGKLETIRLTKTK